MDAVPSNNRVELRCIADVYNIQRGRARVFLAVKPDEVVAIEEAVGRRDIDAALIASPDHLHSTHTLAVLRAGKHIYLEKPATHNFDEGAKLIAAVKQSGKVCQTGTQQRSGAHYRRAKAEIFERGKI